MPIRSEGRSPPSPAPISTPIRAAAGEKARFSDLLGTVTRRVDAGEALMRQAMRPSVGSLDAAGLIAIQAGIYRYTEALELAGKLVDRTSNAVRTVLSPSSH